MKYPDGYLWYDPGFPSLTVSYLKTNDFFFSGHVGLPVLASLEFFVNNKKILMIFAIITAIIEFITMVFTRGHYIIDLICGAIIAHYIFMLVEKFVYKIDNFFSLGNTESEKYKPIV
jgi:hypothetical protein